MKRQVILLEGMIDVFREELGHVLEDVDSPGPGRPPVYPAKGMFLCWLFIYLGLADSQRRLIDFLMRHPEWRDGLGFDDRVPDQFITPLFLLYLEGLVASEVEIGLAS